MKEGQDREREESRMDLGLFCLRWLEALLIEMEMMQRIHT